MMIMNKRYIKLAGLFTAALALMTGISSCEKQLGALPSQSKVDDNLIVDAPSAEVALNGAYYAHAMCDLDFYGVEAAGNPLYTELLPAGFAGVLTTPYGDYIIHGEEDNGYVEYLWTSLYQQMSPTSFVIAGVEALDDKYFSGNRKKEIISEAKVLRAMIHSNILRYFGYSWDISSPYGIILRMAPSTVSTIAAPRSSVKETYDSIIEDLDYAIANGPSDRPNYFVNKWVAMGLKARVLMMRGEGSDYSDAAALCADIINNGPYSFEENTTDIFHVKGLESNEVMFGIKPKPSQQVVQKAYFPYKGWYDEYNLTQNFYDLFADSDARKGTIVNEMVDSYGDAYLVPNKHFSPGNEFTTSTASETMVEMRLTEMALLQAEALARTGKLDESKAVLKEVEARAGVSDFSAIDDAADQGALLEELFKEEMRNLYCEAGIEGNTMLRFPSEIVSAFHEGFSEKQFYVLPIPKSEFDYNSALDISRDQNPGY